jgi:clan AA aspartic protease
MIVGLITADREGIIRLLVRGPRTMERRIEAVIDTGYDGWLSLPPGLITQLRLPWRRRGSAVLADGSDILFDIFEGTVLWDKRPRRVPIDEADTIPLVGMALLDGYELTMLVRTGGKLTIKRMR